MFPLKLEALNAGSTGLKLTSVSEGVKSPFDLCWLERHLPSLFVRRPLKNYVGKVSCSKSLLLPFFAIKLFLLPLSPC
jgi:hypothetical protein